MRIIQTSLVSLCVSLSLMACGSSSATKEPPPGDAPMTTEEVLANASDLVEELGATLEPHREDCDAAAGAVEAFRAKNIGRIRKLQPAMDAIDPEVAAKFMATRGDRITSAQRIAVELHTKCSQNERFAAAFRSLDGDQLDE